MWQRFSSLPISCVLSLAAIPAAAQVEITIHGGLHAGVGAAQYGREQQPSRPSRSSNRLLGEATTAGARLGVAISERWQIEGGAAWARSSNWEGAVSRALPSVEDRTMFLSGTLQGWLTSPESRVGVVAGLGPALIQESRRGASSARHVNLGGLVSIGGVMRLDRRLSVRIDAQQYLFSSPLDRSYAPHFGALSSAQPSSALRHDLVILAGFSWRSD
ncbi:MAG TPA: hypothetical protein VFR72_04215 [Gemmatimonadales bacterium]|nr:hypothetical protein [Gemmatimonadales bacterium]